MQITGYDHTDVATILKVHVLVFVSINTLLLEWETLTILLKFLFLSLGIFDFIAGT